MKRYFSSESAHGSESSHGFSNDTIVYAFDSKAARDTYVEESRNISCKAIRFRDVTTHATNMNLSLNSHNTPRPFHNEFWGIVDASLIRPDDPPAGLIGQVECCDDYSPGVIDRLYK